MRYTNIYKPEKAHKITGKDMLVSALSNKTGKSEKELKKLSKIELRKMWDSLSE